jgi:hypothetical protein
MDLRSSLGIIALATAVSITAAFAFDDSQYPNFSGVWRKPAGIGNQWDQTKPLGLAQQPPFTPEYQAIFEASLADIKAGGQGNDAPSRCVPFAMPRVMTVVFDMEIVITPAATYMLFAHSMPRRILTDGSDWPKEIEPTFLGHSIGRWVDVDNDDKYDALEIETRGLKGPRTYEGTGMPFHVDNQTVVKERLFLDRGNPDARHRCDELWSQDRFSRRPRELAPGRAVDTNRSSFARIHRHDRRPRRVGAAMDRQARLQQAERPREQSLLRTALRRGQLWSSGLAARTAHGRARLRGRTRSRSGNPRQHARKLRARGGPVAVIHPRR